MSDYKLTPEQEERFDEWNWRSDSSVGKIKSSTDIRELKILLAQEIQRAVEAEKKNRVTLKAKGKGLSPRDFAGSFWTEGFRKKGVDEVVIKVDGEPSILLDWNMPITRYKNEDDRQKWEEYIHQRAKNGWRWCASWSYGMFEAPTKTETTEEAQGKNWYFEGDELVITKGKWVIDRYKQHPKENHD